MNFCVATIKFRGEKSHIKLYNPLFILKVLTGGVTELQQYVDTLIVIPNHNLFRIANERTTFADAFKMADDVLHAGVRGVTDLMIMPGPLTSLIFAVL